MLNENKTFYLDPEKETLVVRFNCMLCAETMQKIKDDIMEQVKTGIVVLPPYCTIIIMNKDSNLEVKVV